MKQFFLESGADVIRAVESEIEAIESHLSGSLAASESRSDQVPSATTTGSGQLSYLSVLLGLVESQLIHPNNLTPINKRQEEGRHATGDAGDELLHLKSQEQEQEEPVSSNVQSIDDDDDTEVQDSDQLKSGVDFLLPNPIPFSRIRFLSDQFKSLIRGSIDMSNYDLVSRPNDRQALVSKVADVIWSHLSTSSDHQLATQTASGHANSHHAQFLSSFLIDRRLDSFGITFAVYAALQVLLSSNTTTTSSPSSSLFAQTFRLVLSEDHSWIVVRTGDQPDSSWTRVEVTWHGKADKRRTRHDSSSGMDYSETSGEPDNWLYLKNHAVVCESVGISVSALISSLNPAISANSDSLPLALIQRNLLLCLHRRNLLSKYPMALGTLADLIELTSTTSYNQQIEQRCLDLYIESIAAARTHYDDHHIYPYLYLAGHAFRHNRFSESLFQWKLATKVLSRYNYRPKEDEEVYRELQEISNDLIPYAISRIIQDSPDGLTPENYRDLIEFYDGLCGWEEDSKWPVLHVGWSKSLVQSLQKFPANIRAQILIRVAKEKDEDKDSAAPKEPTKDNWLTSVVSKCADDPSFLLNQPQQENVDEEVELQEDKVVVEISSAKMIELKDLLVKKDKKLNSQAIQLQITAQSSLFSSHPHVHHHHSIQKDQQRHRRPSSPSFSSASTVATPGQEKRKRTMSVSSTTRSQTKKRRRSQSSSSVTTTTTTTVTTLSKDEVKKSTESSFTGVSGEEEQVVVEKKIEEQPVTPVLEEEDTGSTLTEEQQPEDEERLDSVNEAAADTITEKIGKESGDESVVPTVEMPVQPQE